MDEEPTLQEIEQQLASLRAEDERSQKALDAKTACEQFVKKIAPLDEPLVSKKDNEWSAAVGGKGCC